MKFQKDFIQKSLSDLAGHSWYRQRFDGSPMYLFAVAEPELKKESRKPTGTEALVRVCFFHDEKADWYLDMADIRRGSRVMIDLAVKDPDISSRLMERWRYDERAFQNFFDTFLAAKLPSLSDARLLNLFRRYRQLFTNRFTSSAIIDHFALGTDQHIAAMIRSELGTLDRESNFTDFFSKLTAPVHQSFINQAEVDLLELIVSGRTSRDDLERHRQKYFWIKNNYTMAHVIDVAHFEREVEGWRSLGVDLTEKLRDLKETPARNARAKRELFQKYNFSPLLRTLLKISEDFTWWQDERKKSTFLNIHLGQFIFGEMSRRKHVDPDLMKYLVPTEVEDFFQGRGVEASLLEKRREGCVVVAREDSFFIGVSSDVFKVRPVMFPESDADQVKDLRGLTASVGRVIGPVKIVDSVREIGKVESGDVLVAVMTRPDYMAGIKKAAAIVTNEGGITCHAAIVSRELGIPCIIGTKIATDVLRDGDVVEVNANHGVVTIIGRRN